MASSGDPKGYYGALGVAREAAPDEIRAAFRERAKVLHPDGVAGSDDDEGFRKLAEAYAVLRDPRRRVQYDAEALGGVGAGRTPPEPSAEPRAGPAPAETRWDDALRAEPDPVRRRGERPQRVTPIAAQRPPLAASTGWIAAAIVLSLLVLVGGGVIWRMRAGLGEQAAQIAELTGRLETLAASEHELRARLEAQTVASVADAVSGAIPAGLGGRAVFARDIPFQPGSADLDRPLEIMIDAVVVELSRALRAVPADQPWHVVVEGYAGSAAADGGVAVAAWETALLRLGAVIERLLAQGVPEERVATRFNAGFAAGHDTAVVELKLICCTR